MWNSRMDKEHRELLKALVEELQHIRFILDALIDPNRSECPECRQNREDGMNFCAYCGQRLWDKGR